MILDVIKVILQLFPGVMFRGTIRVAKLRPATDARLYPVPLMVIRDVFR